ncbi:splicing factor U2af large subunit A [Drosophila elegans]|uniref:splicing factor U2af large subunit A n=1 Tax=Drosophila elegans TaxID=30023 RepID=UPI0007E6AD84|nr:splicing factor U2af large subunit A [Drosophila elegans]
MSGGDRDREQLRLFVAASRRRLHDLLKRLHWSEEGVLGEHQSPTDEGLASETLEQLPASCCTNSAFSLQLDSTDIQRIVGKGSPVHPSSFDDLQAGLNASQRLLIYEHVLQHTAKHPEFQDNAAFAELVGETRRERKKQRRHRKSKPTLNEELQQLVDLQMQALQRQRQREQDHRDRHREHKDHRERHKEHHQKHKESHQKHKEHRERHQQLREHHQEHMERHREQHRSRKRSRSRSRSPDRHRHGHRHREQQEHRRQHYGKHKYHTSDH